MTRRSSSSISGNTSARNSVNSAERTRAEQSQSKSERFEQLRMAVHERRAAKRERYVNAFKRAGSAFRLWWLMLLGVMSKVVRPIVGRTDLGANSFAIPARVRRDSARRKMSAVEICPAEQLEVRQLLTAELSIVDVNPSGVPLYRETAIVGDNLYFVDTDAVSGAELRKLDSTTGTVSLVADINPGLGDSMSSPFSSGALTAVGTKLYFQAYDPINGTELRWIDTAAATPTVNTIDIYSGSSSSDAGHYGGFIAVGDKLFFNAEDATNGIELRWIDTTEATPTLNTLDIYSGADSSAPAQFGGFEVIGNKLFFSARDAAQNIELRWIDTTQATPTVNTIDVNSDTESSLAGAVGKLTAFGDKLYFSADDSTNGTELRWIDTTEASPTVHTIDVASGTASSYPGNYGFIAVGNKLYFTANDADNGTELRWIDMTSANPTVNTFNINVDFESSEAGSYGGFALVGTKLYFTAYDTTNGAELRWIDTAAAEPAVNTLDVLAGVDSSVAGFSGFKVVGNRLFFAARDTINSFELRWINTLEPLPTVHTIDINTGDAGSEPGFYGGFNLLGTKLYFTAFDATHGYQLRWIDTADSTLEVNGVNIHSGSDGSDAGYVSGFTPVGSKLYFTAYDNVRGSELRWIDMSAASPEVHTIDIASGDSSTPKNLTVVGTNLYFTAYSADDGTELRWIDTIAATPTVNTIRVATGSDSSDAGKFGGLTVVGNRLFFTAYNALYGIQLWWIDTTAESPSSTLHVIGINEDSSNPGEYGGFKAVGDKLYFTAQHPTLGTELHWIDATAANPEANTINIYAANGDAATDGDSFAGRYGGFIAVGNKLYFTAADEVNGSELHWIDTTVADPTVNTIDIRSGIDSSNAGEYGGFTVVGDKLYFTSTVATNSAKLQWIDTTAANPIVTTVDLNTSFSSGRSIPFGNFKAVGSKLFFTAKTSNENLLRWIDTSSATPTVHTIAGTTSAGAEGFTVVGDLLYFAASDAQYGRELRWIDTTSATLTVNTLDIGAGSVSSNPANGGIKSAGGKLYFSANKTGFGSELFALTSNSEPTDITLSNSTITENAEVAAVVGDLSTTDPDSGDSFTYTLVNGTGDTDNASFTIAGNKLKSAEVFNFEAAKTSYSVRIRTTDSGNTSVEKSFTITVADANDAGDLILSDIDSVRDKQNTSAGVVVGSFSTTDPDEADRGFGSDDHVVSIEGGDASAFSLDGTNIKFNAGVLDVSAKSSYSTTLRLVDGPNTIEKLVTVDVLSLQQQIDNAESGDTLTLIPGVYNFSLSIVEKDLTIHGDGVTIYGTSPALIIDDSTVSISGMTFLNQAGESMTAAAALVQNGGSLTLAQTTITQDDDSSSVLIEVDETSSLDLSSGDNVLELTVAGSAFIAATSGSTVLWDENNTLNVIANEDEPFVLDVRVNGSPVVNLFTTPETEGFVVIEEDGTLTYTPSEDFNGSATFDFELESGEVGTVTVVVRAVNDQPTFVIDSDVTVDEDASGTQTVEGQIDLASVVYGPDNENNQSGTFTVTATNSDIFRTQPAIDEDGNLTFELSNIDVNSLKAGESLTSDVSVTLIDDGGTENGGIDTSETLTFTITVTGKNDAPVGNAATNSGNEDTRISGDLEATDVDHDAVLTFAQVGSVPGLTISSDGSYSFDASNTAYQSLKAGETLDVLAEYEVTDEHGANSTSTLTITVTGTNDDPVALPATKSGAEDSTITGTVTHNDVDHDADLTYTLDEPVDGLILNSDGTYSFDASGWDFQSLKPGESVDVVAYYTVTDEHESSSSSTLTITVTGTNDAPVITIDDEPTLTTMEDTLTALPINGISVADMDESDSGLSVTLSVRNGILSVDAALASSANITFTGSGTRSVVVSGTATDLNSFLAATGGGPRGRSVAPGSAGITYSPDANYNSVDGVVNSQGAELLTVVATDDLSAMSSAQTKTITVTEVNDAPTGNSVTKTVVENAAVTFNVLTVASPGPAIESPNQWITLIGGGRIVAAHGFVTFNLATGAVTYRPASSYVGSDTFSFRVRDNGTTNGVAARLTKEVTVTVTVLPGNHAPVITSNGGGSTANISVAENTTAITSVTASDTDLPAQTLTYSISGGADAAAFAIHATTGVLTFVAGKNFESPSDTNADGIYEVDVRVSDGSLSDTQSIQVTVTDVNEAPTVTLSNVITSLSELTSVTSRVRIADIVITDDALGTEVLTVTGVDAASFEIVGTSLFLKAETNLNANAKATYSYTVRAADGTFTSTASATLQIATSVPAIVGPASVNVSMRPTLAWTSIPGATYEIILREATQAAPGSKIVLGIVDFPVSSTSYTPSENLGIGRFDFCVRSVSSTGIKSAWSAPYIFNVSTPVTITPPSDLRQSVPRPTISWEALAGAVKYEVWVGDISDLAAVAPRIIHSESTSTSWTHSSDLPIGRYRMWVRGADESGAFRNWSAPTEFIVVPAPVLTRISSTFDRTPTFTWTAVLGAQSYEIVVKSATNGAEVFRQTVTGTSATPSTNLSVGSYTWQVSATGAAEYRSNSSTSSLIFVGGRPVVNPAVVNNGIPTFSWLTVQGAATYQIRVDRTDLVQNNVINKSNLHATTTSYTPTTPLTPGTYRFWIRAFSANPADGSYWSQETTFTVAANETAPSGDSGVEESLLAVLTSRLPKTGGIAKPQEQPATAVVAETDMIAVNDHKAPNGASPMFSLPASQTSTTEKNHAVNDTAIEDATLFDVAVSNVIDEGLLDQGLHRRESV